jgi:hypothetical protein
MSNGGDDLYGVLDGLTNDVGEQGKIEANHTEGGGLEITYKGNITQNTVDVLQEEKAFNSFLEKPNFDRDGFFHAYTIPPEVTTLWYLRDGFHAGSHKLSNMEPDDHYKELKRRVALEFPLLNVSRYKNL